MNERVNIAGVGFDPVTRQEALTKPGRIVTPNPEMVVYANRHPEFKNTLNTADLSIADGIGIVWAAHFLSEAQGKKGLSRLLWLIVSLLDIFLRPARLHKILPERVTGVDLMESLAAEAAQKGWGIYLLGAAPGVAEAAAKILKVKHPSLRMAGTHAGSPGDAEAPQILERIRAARPEMLFVAYGSPAQEVWLARHLKSLPTVKTAMGVGGAFDFLSGHVRRAPAPFRRWGLEWLWRLMVQPWRLGRIYRATAVFISIVFRVK